IPPVKEAIENTGPGIARTIPIPVVMSSLSICITLGFFSLITAGRTENCSYIIGIKTCPPPNTKLPMRYKFSKRFIGFRLGQSFLRATSLVTPANKNMIANNQIFHHFIFFGFVSICGIRLWLILVLTPPRIIRTGNIHGVLKNKYVAIPQIAIIIQVIIFFIEILKAATEAYARKPTASGGINLKMSVCSDFLSMYSNRNEKPPIKKEAGKIQITRVAIANGMPPLLYPISVTVWVDDAPGNKLQKALYSNNSFSVT